MFPPNLEPVPVKGMGLVGFSDPVATTVVEFAVEVTTFIGFKGVEVGGKVMVLAPPASVETVDETFQFGNGTVNIVAVGIVYVGLTKVGV